MYKVQSDLIGASLTVSNPHPDQERLLEERGVVRAPWVNYNGSLSCLWQRSSDGEFFEFEAWRLRA
jgi:hypothetical protein